MFLLLSSFRLVFWELLLIPIDLILSKLALETFNLKFENWDLKCVRVNKLVLKVFESHSVLFQRRNVVYSGKNGSNFCVLRLYKEIKENYSATAYYIWLFFLDFVDNYEIRWGLVLEFLSPKSEFLIIFLPLFCFFFSSSFFCFLVGFHTFVSPLPTNISSYKVSFSNMFLVKSAAHDIIFAVFNLWKYSPFFLNSTCSFDLRIFLNMSRDLQMSSLMQIFNLLWLLQGNFKKRKELDLAL